jgi:hypothetical protein
MTVSAAVPTVSAEGLCARGEAQLVAPSTNSPQPVNPELRITAPGSG